MFKAGDTVTIHAPRDASRRYPFFCRGCNGRRATVIGALEHSPELIELRLHHLAGTAFDTVLCRHDWLKAAL